MVTIFKCFQVKDIGFPNGIFLLEPDCLSRPIDTFVRLIYSDPELGEWSLCFKQPLDD